MNDVKLLHPELQPIVEQFLAKCKEQGFPVIITQTMRTKDEQDALYAQGRTKPGSIVTNVKYPNSGHCWGVCFDFARNVKGKEWDNSDRFFNKVGAIGKSLGLSWGGDWSGFVDLPHLEMAKYMPNNSTSMLVQKYGTPENFKATWGKAPAPAPATPPTTAPVQGPLVDQLVSLGVIDNKDYVKDVNAPLFDSLMSNATRPKLLHRNIDNGITDVETALKVLFDAGIITAPDHWRGIINGGNAKVKRIILSMANRSRVVMEKIIEAEAGGEDDKGKLLVGNVVMNRHRVSSFPNGIYNVVFQKDQFAPIVDGAYNRVKPSDRTKAAVDRVLNGEDQSQGATFFQTINSATANSWHEKNLQKLFDYGGHRFYK